MALNRQPKPDTPLGFLRRYLRRRQIERLHRELDTHLLYDIGLLDVEPRLRENDRRQR